MFFFLKLCYFYVLVSCPKQESLVCSDSGNPELARHLGSRYAGRKRGQGTVTCLSLVAPGVWEGISGQPGEEGQLIAYMGAEGVKQGGGASAELWGCQSSVAPVDSEGLGGGTGSSAWSFKYDGDGNDPWYDGDSWGRGCKTSLTFQPGWCKGQGGGCTQGMKYRVPSLGSAWGQCLGAVHERDIGAQEQGVLGSIPQA